MAPSHYLNQCWNIVNFNLRCKFQWNVDQFLYIFIQENAFENVVCEIAAILSRPQCVNTSKVIVVDDSYISISLNSSTEQMTLTVKSLI